MHDSIYRMTWQQRQLAEIIWDLGPGELASFVRALPDEMQIDAVLVYEILVLENIDHMIQTDQDVAQAAEILHCIAKAI